MKQYLIGLCVATAMGCNLAGCDEDHVTYSGPDYVMFSDTLSTIAIQNDDYHDVYVAATQACDYDRTYGIEIVDKESNAIEGKHYSIESNSVTIKAGEYAAALRIRGNYDRIADTDSIGVTLRLVNKEQTWNVYGDKARIVLRKVCPFDLNTFTRYCRVTSTYYEAHMPGVEERIIMTESDPEEENTVILKDFFYKGYDIKLHFNTKDPLQPQIEMEDGQVIASTSEVFGGPIGDGNLRVQQPVNLVSYYNVCQHYVMLYFMLYAQDGDQVQTENTYLTILEWISDAEAGAKPE